MEIILIAAMASNRVIGKDNAIPWHIPGELKRFKKTTWGHGLIMGRKTHESIGRPLPGRRNIIVSRNTDYFARGCEVVHSLPDAYALCSDMPRVFNIGGAQLYRHGIVHADTLILTLLPEPIDGDAYFPPFSDLDFKRTAVEKFAGVTPYVIETYCKKKPRNNFSQ